MSNEQSKLEVVQGGRQSDARNQGQSLTGYGGSGGGGGMSNITIKDYVDAQDEKTRAQNDARFAEVLSRLDGLNPATWWQNALLLVGALGIMVAILAFASDRFDSGVSAMGAVEERLDAERDVNEAQNQRLDRLLNALEVLNDGSASDTE